MGICKLCYGKVISKGRRKTIKRNAQKKDPSGEALCKVCDEPVGKDFGRTAYCKNHSSQKWSLRCYNAKRLGMSIADYIAEKGIDINEKVETFKKKKSKVGENVRKANLALHHSLAEAFEDDIDAGDDKEFSDDKRKLVLILQKMSKRDSKIRRIYVRKNGIEIVREQVEEVSL